MTEIAYPYTMTGIRSRPDAAMIGSKHSCKNIGHRRSKDKVTYDNYKNFNKSSSSDTNPIIKSDNTKNQRSLKMNFHHTCSMQKVNNRP